MLVQFLDAVQCKCTKRSTSLRSNVINLLSIRRSTQSIVSRKEEKKKKGGMKKRGGGVDGYVAASSVP